MNPVVVGKPEIAVLLGVDRATPGQWVKRDLLPEPDHPPVNGAAAWRIETIMAWAVRTNRFPLETV